MKRLLFISLFILFALSLSAQRKVRKETHKGDTNYREQRYGAAEEKYKKAIEVYDKSDAKAKEKEQSIEAFYNLGNTYYRQQRWDEALAQYDAYAKLQTNPLKKSNAWSNIGNTYLRKSTDKNAKPDPQQAQAAGGQNVPQQTMGQEDQIPRMEQLKQSMEAYKNALRLNPADNNTRYNLAVVQKMIQDQEDKNKDNKQDQKKDKQQDKQDQKQDPKDDKQDQKKDEKDKDERKEDQMSKENIDQILEAIEQDAKETQSRVQQQKAEERKKQNIRNKKQNKRSGKIRIIYLFPIT